MNDPLTEVHDRLQFIKILKSSVNRSNEEKSKLALLVIHLNRLQRINEIHDYIVGDHALKYLANRLTEVKRSQDFLGRISGATFAIALVGIMNKGHAQLAAHKILRLLEIPLEVEDKRIFIDVSIGISLCPSHSSIATGLLKKAEAALSLAHLCENKISFSPDVEKDEISEFWDIELGIEEAIINSEFKLYYQPKISLKTGLPIGAEALIRWPHPSRGMIYPDQFIPIAEDHGHIKPMTIWILNVALRESIEWTNKWGPLSVSINVPPELMNAELVDLVENALNIWHPENIKLVLEILERSFALSDDSTFNTFQALQDLGAEISIDDFGTGYSALAYFKNIPAKELKIDQSFVRTLIEEKGNLDIVTFVIRLAHAFNMRVVAEGVETIESTQLLQLLGCDYIQGYYLSKPMPHNEFLKWLENYQPLANVNFGEPDSALDGTPFNTKKPAKSNSSSEILAASLVASDAAELSQTEQATSNNDVVTSANSEQSNEDGFDLIDLDLFTPPESIEKESEVSSSTAPSQDKPEEFQLVDLSLFEDDDEQAISEDKGKEKEKDKKKTEDDEEDIIGSIDFGDPLI